MGGGDETVGNVLVACLARLGADVSGTRNLRRSYHLGLAHVGARNNADANKYYQQEQGPAQIAALMDNGL